jgi:streptomycin 6-kinase
VESARQIADTVAGIVFDVTLADCGPAVIKALKAKALEDSLRGADFMAWRDGFGCARLIERSDDMLLMEHAGTVTLRDHLQIHGDDDAARVAAEVLLAYHGPSGSPAPASLQPLSRYFASLFGKAERDRRNGIEGPFTEAASIAETLIANQQDIKPLHGDLHHENIMYGPRGWLIIDPAGLIGDPALDVANMFSNPLDRFDLTRSEKRIAEMAGIFSAALKRDVRTILRYAFAYACLSAAWHEEDGNAKDHDDELAVAAAIKSVLAQA